LDGPAQVWYQNYVNDPKNVFNTWAIIRTDFLKEFAGDQPFRKLKFKLNTR